MLINQLTFTAANDRTGELEITNIGDCSITMKMQVHSDGDVHQHKTDESNMDMNNSM